MSENNTESTTVAKSEGTGDGRMSRPRSFGLILLWSAVVAIPGGYACGHALAGFSILGSFVFLLLGVVAGWTARAVIAASGKRSAACLTGACLIACGIALVFRIRLTNPMMSWRDALSWLGPSLESDRVFATFTIGCALLGGLLASFFVLRRKTVRDEC